VKSCVVLGSFVAFVKRTISLSQTIHGCVIHICCLHIDNAWNI